MVSCNTIITYKNILKGWFAEKAYMAIALPLYAVLDKFGVKDDRRAEDENEIYIDYIKHYGWLRPDTTVSLEQIIPYADWKKARKLADCGHTDELYALLDSWVKERQLNLNFPFIRDNNIKLTSELPDEIILPWLKKWEIIDHTVSEPSKSPLQGDL